MKTKVRKAKEGRPTKYEPRFCKVLLDHFKQGLSFESFGGVIGVSRDTLYEWEKVHPEFSDAKKQGVAASQLFWEKEGQKGLWIQEGEPKLNTTAWIFAMKNRFGWRDRQDPEVVIKNSTTVGTNVQSEEDQLLANEMKSLLVNYLTSRERKD